MRQRDIRRVRFGTFVRPGAETGSGAPRVEELYGYLVPLATGYLLFDTGFGEGDLEIDAWYRPRRVPLADALAAVGGTPDEVALIANCHLHFDHIGGNPALAGVPILCQRAEYEAALAGDHTIEALVDFPGAVYRLLDGDAEAAPGIHVLSTPGHTVGHQSLWVDCIDGPVLLAGQTHDTTSAWSADALAVRTAALDGDDDAAPVPAWLPDLLRRGPARVAFAHDAAVWIDADVHTAAPWSGEWRPPADWRTERLVLRPHRLGDLDDLLAFHGDADVVRYLPWPVRDREATAVTLRNKLSQGVSTQPGARIVLAIEERASGVVIGELTLMRPDVDDGSAEIGYVLRADRHGRGLAAEATRELVRFAFEELGLTRLQAVVESPNAASMRLLGRLGFVRDDAHDSVEPDGIRLLGFRLDAQTATERSAQ